MTMFDFATLTQFTTVADSNLSQGRVYFQYNPIVFPNVNNIINAIVTLREFAVSFANNKILPLYHFEYNFDTTITNSREESYPKKNNVVIVSGWVKYWGDPGNLSDKNLAVDDVILPTVNVAITYLN